MTALDEASRRYSAACEKQRHVTRLRQFGRATYAQVQQAAAERAAAWQDYRAARGEGR